MPGKAPVDRVGGTQADGPWSETVEEIVEGDQHTRPVELADGSRSDVTVTIDMVREHNGGYVVAYSHDDPTAGGGA